MCWLVESENLVCINPEGVDRPEQVSHVEATLRDGHSGETPGLHFVGPDPGAGRGVECYDRVAADGKHHTIGVGNGCDDRSAERVAPHDLAVAGIDGAD